MEKIIKRIEFRTTTEYDESTIYYGFYMDRKNDGWEVCIMRISTHNFKTSRIDYVTKELLEPTEFTFLQDIDKIKNLP